MTQFDLHSHMLKQNKIAYLYLLVIISLSFSVFKTLPIFERTWLFYLIGCSLPFILCKGYFKQKQIIAALFYLFIVAVNWLTGDSYFRDINWVMHEVAGLIIPTSLLYYVLYSNDEKLLKKTLCLYLFIVLYTTIASFFINIDLPGAVRYVYAYYLQGGDMSDFSYLFRFGLSNYTFPHGIPMLIPPLMMGYRNKYLSKRTHIICLILIAGCLLMTYLSGATMALIIGLFIFIMAFFVKEGTLQSNITKLVVISMIAAPIILSEDIQLSALETMDKWANYEGDFHQKIVEIEDIIRTGSSEGTDIESRDDRYTLTLKAIISGNMFFGTNGNTGEHTAIFDRLAVLGLVGFIPFLIFLVTQLKVIILYISPNRRVYYYLGLLAGILMMITKAICNWDMWLPMLAILPMMMLFFGRKNDKVF